MTRRHLTSQRSSSTAVRGGEIFLVNLHPTRGPDLLKTQSCLIVSPNELNARLRAFIAAPLTTPALAACGIQGLRDPVHHCVGQM